MKEEEKSKQFILGIFPKCPFYKSVQSLSIILALITLGTVGIYFLNLWAAAGYLIYSILSYFLLMPFTMCKFCYFKVNENTVGDLYGHSMVFTYCPNCHFILFGFLYICFNNFNWLYSYAGWKLFLHVARKMSNMRYQGRMPFIFLKLKCEKKLREQIR